ncbi:MAG: thioredoxin domain-containing protein [Gemmatimonadaceae bacterium]|nr:thioredoxin domain-containing protein [Gemmatimonadaceae bacterium]
MRPALLVIAAVAVAACTQADARPLAANAPRIVDLPAQAPGGQQKALPDPRVTRADLARIDGKPEAKLWILVVSDFQCPFCKEYHEKTEKQVHKEFVETGIARLAYINYPLKIHKNAVPAAEAAMCGGAQDKFWPFHDRLFATVGTWGNLASPSAAFEGIAAELKLNVPIWKKCVADHVMVPMIQADYQRGSSAGASSTPTFLIGRVVIPGNAPIEVFRTAVKETLAGTM